VQAVEEERFEVPEFESNLERLPARSARKVSFGIYQFVDAPAQTGGWFDLDVGRYDALHTLRFHASERADGVTFRWSQDVSYVTATTMTTTARTVTLVLSDGGRPPAAPPALVTVYLGDERLGEFRVMPGPFHDYTVAIPPGVAERAAAAQPPILRLVSTVWNPHDVLGTPDNREIGVMLDRVTIK
jgi:hypothetical protein